MQLHTGEHILSGLVHKHFGYDNVGFHMGAEEVTVDLTASLSRRIWIGWRMRPISWSMPMSL